MTEVRRFLDRAAQHRAARDSQSDSEMRAFYEMLALQCERAAERQKAAPPGSLSQFGAGVTPSRGGALADLCSAFGGGAHDNLPRVPV